MVYDPYRQIGYRQLTRRGICSCCAKDIDALGEHVLTFRGKRELVVICNTCLDVGYVKAKTPVTSVSNKCYTNP